MKKLNNILIVNNEPINLALLELSLKELENINIIFAFDSYQAFDFLKEKSIDLIIVDLSMPELGGLDFLSILKRDKPIKYIPVIVITAEIKERYKALEIGAEDFLSKPIDVIELRFKVTNLLRLKKFNDLLKYFNERLEEEVTSKEKQLKKFAQIEQELLLAREIQQRLIPKSYPKSNQLDIYGSCVSASEVGGDYLDVFQTDSKEYTVFIIADVSGHGFASALISMQFRSLARIELMKGSDDFGAEVERINTVFSNDNEDGNMFITALFLRFHHKTSTIESVNAGHYDPLGEPKLIHTEETKGLPIGVMPDISYGVIWAPFNKGNALFLYTDGIIECENIYGEMYDNRIVGLYECLQPFHAKKQIELILEAFHEFIYEQNDDVTILAIKAL